MEKVAWFVRLLEFWRLETSTSSVFSNKKSLIERRRNFARLNEIFYINKKKKTGNSPEKILDPYEPWTYVPYLDPNMIIPRSPRKQILSNKQNYLKQCIYSNLCMK